MGPFGEGLLIFLDKKSDNNSAGILASGARMGRWIIRPLFGRCCHFKSFSPKILRINHRQNKLLLPPNRGWTYWLSDNPRQRLRRTSLKSGNSIHLQQNFQAIPPRYQTSPLRIFIDASPLKISIVLPLSLRKHFPVPQRANIQIFRQMARFRTNHRHMQRDIIHKK